MRKRRMLLIGTITATATTTTTPTFIFTTGAHCRGNSRWMEHKRRRRRARRRNSSLFRFLPIHFCFFPSGPLFWFVWALHFLMNVDSSRLYVLFYIF